MKRIALPATVLGGILIALVQVAPAQAQATRTWVSGVGDDFNPCSRTAPCKTFAGAISKTATSGEINCLDSGGFGTVNITKSITIRCNGVIGGVLAAGTTGIIVNNAAAEVILDGLTLNGAGTGTTGIRVIAASKVWIMNTKVQGFLNNGLQVEATSSHVFVDDTFIINNGNTAGTFGGVNVAGTGNIVNLRNTQVTANGNGATGFALNASTASAIASIQQSALNDSANAISRIAGATVICVGPSNLVSGAAPAARRPCSSKPRSRAGSRKGACACTAFSKQLDHRARGTRPYRRARGHDDRHSLGRHRVN